MKIGFYHHGTLPAQKDAEVINEVGMKVFGRNASSFDAKQAEKFDHVVVDDGPNTAAIAEAYKDNVQTVGEFAKNPPKAAKGDKAVLKALNPDKPAKKPEPKPQGK
ncbi:hypothetical protein QWJ07_03965 [Frankia sp. RB7]|nr:hypothetical protein [Frankia sp. RB7]